MKRVFSIFAFVALTGCASIASGTSQDIAINTTPPGATCTLKRLGLDIGTLATSPGQVTVQKTKDEITLICSKAGYEDTTFIVHSGSEGFTAGNIIAGGLIGWGIDSATGADNKYDSPVNITLARKN